MMDSEFNNYQSFFLPKAMVHSSMKLITFAAMNVHMDLDTLPDFSRSIVTIGSFDGIHHGHRQILVKLRKLSVSYNCPSIVITFHPHPRQVLFGDKSFKLLSSLREKIQELELHHVDHLVVIPFSKEFSNQTPESYIENFLIKKFKPKCIVIGFDHRFGNDREGNINLLRKYSKKHNFDVVEIEKQTVENIKVSSTKIRNAIRQGNISFANQLLGHPYRILGTVIKGNGIGKTLGFPTANLDIESMPKLLPPIGIYAVQILVRGTKFKGMLYIGPRPTISDDGPLAVEVNIFDFNQDIYGEVIAVDLIEYIRADMKFSGLEELKDRLKQDEITAIQRLQNLGSKPLVAIVILNYNGIDFLKKFLDQVTNSPYENLRVFVADNGSTDKSCRFIEQHPKATLIDLKKNYGFAQGYNECLEKIDAEYYVLLNSDVEVQGDWINPIIDKMEDDPTIAVCQPTIRSFKEQEKFEYAGAAGGLIDKFGYPFCRGRIFDSIEDDCGQYENDQEIFWASGAAFFIKARLFHEIGGFDGDYFAHFEEIDLCWRLKTAGYRIWTCSGPKVFHVGGGTLAYTRPLKTFLNFRNSLITIYKNEKRLKLVWIIPLRLVLDGLAALLFLSQGKWKNITAIIRAHWSFFGSYLTWKKKRREIQSRIKRMSIGPVNMKTGVYPGFLAWQYYSRGKRTYADLIKND